MTGIRLVPCWVINPEHDHFDDVAALHASVLGSVRCDENTDVAGDGGWRFAGVPWITRPVSTGQRVCIAFEARVRLVVAAVTCLSHWAPQKV